MQILIADDDPNVLTTLRDELSAADLEVVTASDGWNAADILRQEKGPLLAILGAAMSGMDGLDVCKRVRSIVKDRYVYMILLTTGGETNDVAAVIAAGADDYIEKPIRPEQLRVRVRVGRRIAALEHELRLQATHDALTGLYNRAAIIEILQKELARQLRQQQAVSVIFADLDYFKHINDSFGQKAGDAILREVTRRMNATLRPYDSFGRYGGEELLAVLPSCDMVGALEVAERMRTAVENTPVIIDGGEVPVTVSIGVATRSKDQAKSVAEILPQAEAALFRAKANGRNCIVVGD